MSSERHTYDFRAELERDLMRSKPTLVPPPDDRAPAPEAMREPPKLSLVGGGDGGKQYRKDRPLARGVLAYFPDALAEVANVSRVANEQHNPGQPMHWAYGKSMDHADCILRHLIDAGTLDDDGLSHTAKVAWRALALLQTELEARDPELHERRQAQRDEAAK